MRLLEKYLKLYFYFIILFLPIVFIQKCEQAYYLPKYIILASGLQYAVLVLLNIRNIKLDMIDKALLIFLSFYLVGIFTAEDCLAGIIRFMEWFFTVFLFLYARYFLNKEDIKKTAWVLKMKKVTPPAGR